MRTVSVTCFCIEPCKVSSSLLSLFLSVNFAAPSVTCVISGGAGKRLNGSAGSAFFPFD